MLFKKGVLPVQKDIVAETYTSALEEHRKSIKDKTEEIKKCLKAKRAATRTDGDIAKPNDQTDNIDKTL